MSSTATILARGAIGSRPAAGSPGHIYFSTEPKTYRDNGSSWDDVSDSGTGLTNPMTTSQDVIVGGASGTPGRLGIGAAGGHLAVINGALAYNSGTAFPASKLTGDRYWRTDLGMEAYWDGTRWVTTEIFHCVLAHANSTVPMSVGNISFRGVLYGSTYDQWLIEMRTAVNAQATNNGSNFWTAVLADQAGGAIGGGVTWNTSADAAGAWVYKTTAIGAVLSGKTEIQLTVNGTGAPGALYIAPIVAYRLVLT